MENTSLFSYVAKYDLLERVGDAQMIADTNSNPIVAFSSLDDAMEALTKHGQRLTIVKVKQDGNPLQYVLYPVVVTPFPRIS